MERLFHHVCSDVICWLLVHPYAPAHALATISVVLFGAEYWLRKIER